jgi:uncharacterized protein (TIGR02145 family)
MKNLSFLFALILIINRGLIAQVSINTDNNPPDPSAMLDVKSTTKGFLPPRVALTAINSASPLTAPADGLLVYNTAVAGIPPNNVIVGYYRWEVRKWVAVSPPQGVNVGDMQYWNGVQWVKLSAGSNGQVLTFNNGVPTWRQLSSPCGTSIIVNHLAGMVAPVDKTVTYGTVSNIPGELTKCWITSNLGADHQAISVDDATEASAGWYWRFNSKQGYKHDGTPRTPNTTWISAINEVSDWTIANDPCAIELGSGWRIPTKTEWTNVFTIGSWTTWYEAWTSELKMHAAGYLSPTDGSLSSRGSYGDYWSSSQGNYTDAWCLFFGSSICGTDTYSKALGLSLRCVRDY